MLPDHSAGKAVDHLGAPLLHHLLHLPDLFLSFMYGDMTRPRPQGACARCPVVRTCGQLSTFESTFVCKSADK